VSKYVRIAVSATLLGWIAWHTDWRRVGQSFAALHGEWWLGALLVLAGCQVASTRRWQLFARELRLERGFVTLLGYYLIGMYFNLLLPTSVGGDVMRAWYLDGGSGRKLASFAAVLLERVNGLVVLVGMACVAVLLSPAPLPAWIPWSVWGIAASAGLGLAALPALVRFRLVPQAGRQQLRTMVQALHAPRAVVEATCWSVLVQVANVVLVWMIGQGLGIAVPLSYYFVFVPMVSLLTLLPVTLNGMGVREGGVAMFLAYQGVEPAAALTLAFLWFAVFAAAGLIGGAVYLGGAYPKPVAPARGPSEVTEGHGSLGRDPDQGREGQLDRAA
jgi:glycosyltransferase 2 family protein